MDIATLVGIISAFAIILTAMEVGGGLILFVDIASVLIVMGGTFGVVMARFSMSQFFSALKVAGVAFIFKSIPPQELIDKIVEISNAARKGGILSLEKIDSGHAFLQKGIQLLVDGHEIDVITSMLKKDMNESLERHGSGASIFQAAGDAAPAMGMIGTLVGLVQMLANLSDPSSIGPSMAVALLTTLYGALIANVIALPICDKLKLRSKEEYRVQKMVIDGIIGVQNGQNPRVLAELLSNYMPGASRNKD